MNTYAAIKRNHTTQIKESLMLMKDLQEMLNIFLAHNMLLKLSK